MRRVALKRKTPLKRTALKRRPAKKHSLRSLKKKAWSLLSQAIRLEAADEQGTVQCVSCKIRLQWNKGVQAGHFIDGRFNGILFDERGVHPQCYACNVLYNGRKEEYWLYMEQTHGRDVIDELRRLRNTERTFTVDELQKMIAAFQLRVKAAKERLGV